MSFRNIQQNSVENSDTFSVIPQQAGRNAGSGTINQYPNGQWFRNPTWPQLPSISASDEKLVGLYAVYPDGSNFIAVEIGGTTSATINWGDGTTSTGTGRIYKIYDFNDVDLADTNGPVTFTDSGDTVNRNNHGYQNDMPISFDSITTTTGITATQIYYVVNATTNTFQLAATPGGSPITLTNDGSGIILPYKIATVTITPTTSGATFNQLVSINVRHTSATNIYVATWLDVAIACSASNINIGYSDVDGQSRVQLGALEQIRILRHRDTSFNNLFINCTKLQNVVEITADTGINVTNLQNMFNACRNLQTIPLFNTASVTNMLSTFDLCTSLQTVPLLNTANVNTMDTAFNGCRSLTSVPLLNTANVTSMSGLFQNCTSLQTVPLLNTDKVTATQNMFSGCTSLQTVPLLNTANVTNTTSMFNGCTNLVSVPLFNTASVTNMSSMFNGCSSLTTVPLLNTANVTVMTNMFQNCTSLQTIPLLNTANVTTMQNMFNACSSLVSVPLLNTANVTTMQNMFNTCSSLVSVPLFNTANVTTMQNMFNTCSSLQTIPLFNTSNTNNVIGMFQNCTILQQIPALNLASVSPTGNIATFATILSSLSKINVANVYYTWTVASNKLAGAQLDEIYTNLPTVFAQATAVTFDGTADTVTLNNHGFAAGRTVSFASITTTTGISTNTNYFVINPTTNTFQISTSRGGSAINLVNNGSGTLNGQTITVSSNWGTATDTPSIATAKGWTVTGS